MPDTYNPFSYIFNANAKPGEPLSYEALQSRRRIAEALMGKRSPFPKTFGEGLTYAGERIADVINARNLAEQERANQAETARFQAGVALPGVIPQGVTPPPAAVPGRRAETDESVPSAPQMAATGSPYVARGAVPGEVPLPPPRPQIDSSRMAGEFDANPGLAKTAASMVNSENPAQGITQLETARNRAIARGTTVAHELQTLGQNRNAYYPQFARGPGDVDAFKRNVLTPVLRGSDVGGQQLGFSPTGNASDEPGNPFATRNLAAGRYNIAGHVPGNTEMYVQQENPAQLARLEAARVPGRDALTQALSGPPPAAPLPEGAQYASLTPPDVTAAVSPQVPAAPYRNPVIPAPPGMAPAPPAVQTAQATSPWLARPPGPFDTLPAQTAPPAGARTQTQAVTARREPVPPNENDVPLNEYQIRGRQALITAGDHPLRQQAAQQLIEYGNQQRAAIIAQKKAEYEQQKELYKAEHTYELTRPKTEAETREIELKNAKAIEDMKERVQRGGVTTEQAFNIVKDSHKDAASIPGEVASIKNAQRVLPSAVTGFGAEAKVNILRVLAAAGQPVDPGISATQQFQSYVKGVYGRLRPQVIGAGPQANAEGKVLEKAAAGDISMDPGAIKAVLDSIYALNVMAAKEHQDKVNIFTGTNPQLQQYSRTFRLPMADIVPDRAVQILREHYKTDGDAALIEFNQDFKTPGLAQEILGIQ
jgi:hypothetical protein